MSLYEFQVGDMVVLSSEEWQAKCAVISQPIASGSFGHALVHVDGQILGVSVTENDVDLADETTQGFAQLAYTLIKLGSHVIEKTLL